MTTQHDEINHPSHYMSKTGLEAIEVIEAFELDYNLGNAVKYILRAGKKRKAKKEIDIKKAMWYLERELKNIQTGPGEDDGDSKNGQ